MTFGLFGPFNAPLPVESSLQTSLLKGIGRVFIDGVRGLHPYGRIPAFHGDVREGSTFHWRLLNWHKLRIQALTQLRHSLRLVELQDPLLAQGNHEQLVRRIHCSATASR